MLTWMLDAISWLYYDNVRPFLDADFLKTWLMGGDIPLIVSLLVMNSLFLTYRLFDSVGGPRSDWNAKPTLFLQGGLIIGNAAVIAADSAARGWI